MTVKEKYYALTAYKVIQAMKKRNIDAFYYETKEEALQQVLEMLKEGSKVSWGGSMSLEEIGLLKEIRKGPYEVLDRDLAKTPEEREEILHKALFSDYYLTSSNAITLDGKLVNMDGRGNRVAAMVYGPKHVIVVAGMNKVEPDEDSAIVRVRNIAGPLNAIRLQPNTPCSNSGLCHRCKVDDCICCQMLITRMSKEKGRLKVVLVGESLGY